MKTNPEQQVDTLVRAVYPIIYIVSHEESRVAKALRRVATQRDRQFFTWSCTRGISDGNGGGTSGEDALMDPLDALEYVNGYNAPAMFAFMDLHAYLDDDAIKRKVRELADSLKTESKTLIIVASSLTLPPELEKQVTVLDWPLPGNEEIGSLFDEVIGRMNSRGLRLEFTPEEREKIITSCLGLTEDEIDNVLAKSLVTHKNVALDVIIGEKAQIIRKSGILDFYPVDESFGNVGGLDNLRRWLEKRGNAFSTRAREFGLPMPKGVVLLGVQGCGKSLICKALASLWKMPLLRFDVGKIFAGIVGSTEANIRRAISTAEAISPCILWIDEMEKGFAGSQSSSMTDGGVTARALSTFLTWQQEKRDPVFTIATCNSIRSMPPEMLRKGRFDEIFFIDLPTREERVTIFTIHLQKRNRNPDNFDLQMLAAASEYFSGAEIESAVEAGMFDAFDEGETSDVTTDHIVSALGDTVPLAVTAKEEIEALRAWAVARARFASNHVEVEVRRGEHREIELDA